MTQTTRRAIYDTSLHWLMPLNVAWITYAAPILTVTPNFVVRPTNLDSQHIKDL